MFRKQPNPRTFEYRPRYFDPETERYQNAGKGARGGIDGMRSRISRHFKEYNQSASSNTGKVKSQVRSSNLRLILILATLFVIAWWMLSYNLERILALLS
jgi:hypothetical protein